VARVWPGPLPVDPMKMERMEDLRLFTAENAKNAEEIKPAIS
jgi:hypothetical protein